MWDAGAIGGRMFLKTGEWSQSIARVERDVGKIKKSLTSFGGDLTSAATKLGVVGAAAQVAFGLFTRHAIHIEEAENLFDVSLGKMADDVREWSDSVSDALAMTGAQIREGAGVFAVMTQSMGLSEEAAASLAKNMVLLAADMASFYNLGHEEALQKLQAGLTGEAEPLKRLGILVNENTVAQWAWAHGVAEAGKQLTDQEKVIARYGTIMEQTQKAQMDLERTADSTQNQLRRLKAQFSEVAGELGAALLPALTTGTQLINEFLSRSREWYKANQDVAESLFVASAGALALAGSLAGLNLAGITTLRQFAAMAIVAGGLAAGIYALNKYWDEARVAIGYWGVGARDALAMLLKLGEGAIKTAEAVKNALFDLMLDSSEFVMKLVLKVQTALSYLPGSFGDSMAIAMGEMQESIDKLDAMRLGREADPAKYRHPTVQAMLEWLQETRPKIEAEAEAMMDRIAEILEQPAGKDSTLVEWLKENVSGISGVLETLKGYEYEPIDIEALMAGIASTADVAEGTRKAAQEAAKELERMQEAGERLYLSLHPVEGALASIREQVAQLQAAGRLDGETRSLLGTAIWQELATVSETTLEQILERVGEFDILLTQTIINAREEAERLKTSLAAEELITAIQPAQVQYIEELRESVELLKEAGRLDAETMNLLSAYGWEQIRHLGGEAINHLLVGLSQTSVEANTLAQNMWVLLEGLTETEESAERSRSTWSTFANVLSEMGAGMRDIGESFGSSLIGQIGGVTSAIGGMISAIVSVQLAMIVLEGTAIAAWMAILGPIYLVIAAITMVLQVVGLFGDKSEDVKKGWSKVLEELEQQMDEWADRLTDTIVEFVKTGEFEIEKFLQGVAEDILRTTITTMFTRPLVGAIGGALFGRGAAFAGGEVVPFAKGGVALAPAYFPMRGGKTGLLGEQGPEAIMPLERSSTGALGVRATGAGGQTTVNIIDQRSANAPPVDMQRRQTPNGEEVRILIRDAIADSIARGELDGLFGLTFGIQRGRA